MTIIEQIKAEIERRITDNTFGAKLELIDILAWLDTLESEKPMNQERFEEEVEKCLKHYQMIAVGKRDFTDIARHFAQWGAEHLKEIEL